MTRNISLMLSSEINDKGPFGSQLTFSSTNFRFLDDHVTAVKIPIIPIIFFADIQGVPFINLKSSIN
jgi:hypothetical protein